MNTHAPLSVGRRRLIQGTAAAAGGLFLGGAMDAGTSSPALGAVPAVAPATANSRTREYWIRADSESWNIVPNGRDNLMGMTFKAADTTYQAVCYRAFTPNWGAPLPASADIGDNSGMPGPVIRGEVGDTILVHFWNNDSQYKFPRSIHPHGVKYDMNSDASWKAYSPNTPGSAVEYGQKYTYTWKCMPDSVGTWIYHDHSKPQPSLGSVPRPVMELGAELGLYGFVIISDSHTRPVDREFFTFLQEWWMEDIKLPQYLMGFNGRAFVDNTPTFKARVGERIRWHVADLGKIPHVFHVHGHRWSNGVRSIDAQAIGSSESFALEWVEDNPGDWLYHCHYPDHMAMGMAGRYVVTT